MLWSRQVFLLYNEDKSYSSLAYRQPALQFHLPVAILN